MRRRLGPLGLILVLGLCLRLPYFWAPFVDGHSFRQVDTAAIARNFHEISFFPFDPQIDWGGRRGYVEAEFPLIPALAAVLHRLFGAHEWFGRIVVLPFAVGLIWAVHRLTLALGGRQSAARAAAFFVAVSPSASFFGRVLMPDTPMLFLATLSLIGFVEFGRTGSTRWLWFGGSSLGAACLVKLPAILVAPAIAVAVLQRRRWPVVREGRVWLAVGVPLALAFAWYLHARMIFEQTGLTFGVSGGASKMYPPAISPGPWNSVFNKWSTWALLSNPEFYDSMFRRFYHLHWTPVGFALAMVGLAVSRTRERWITLAWFAAMLAFVLAMGDVHLGHEYYQLPFVVIAAVWFGAAAWPAFDGAWVKSHVGGGWLGVGAFGALVAALGLVSFHQSGVVRNFFEPHAMAVEAREVGLRIDALTENNDLAVVVDDYGITSPMLLYFAHLKGWSFDPSDVSPALVSHLRDMGARYFATTEYRELERLRPEVVAFLAGFEAVPLVGVPGDARLFDLHQRR